MSRSRSIFGLALLLTALSTAAHAKGSDEQRYIVKFRDAIHGKAAVGRFGGKLALHLGPQRAAAVYLSAAAVTALRSDPSVEYIEKDAIRRPMAQVTPYGVLQTQADLVSAASTTNRTVCIIDSGLERNHEDHSSNPNITGTDVPGTGDWDVDTCGHGTHVAGTVAAVDNSLGVVGVHPSAKLHIVKVFSGADCAWTYSSNLVGALNTCRAAGANIVSMSLGGSFKSRTEDLAFRDAQTAGVLSIAAAGNGGNKSTSYPAGYASVVSVAAVDVAMNVASFSQKNRDVELAAPGVAVLSTVPAGHGRADSLSVGSDGYEAAGMDGTPDASVSGALVDCGTGAAPCAGATDGVCLIQRGGNTFAEKVLNCQAGGGVAAVVYNNTAGLLIGTLGGTATIIPSVGISDTDGAELLGRLGQSATVTTQAGGNYAYFDGTSMATPHVSGIAALVWSFNPAWTNTQVRTALTATALDRGASGRDTSYGYGIVQAQAALDYLCSNYGGGSCP